MARRIEIERPDGQILRFDAWITGNFDGKATVSDHPIEDGSRIADHSQAEPLQISLEVGVTETPLVDDGGPVGEERITEAMRFLDEAGRAGEPLTVTIPRAGVYDQMVLTGWPNTFDRQKSSTFEVMLKQIEIAETVIVRVPIEAIDPPSRAGQQEEVDLGEQPTEEVEEEETGGAARSFTDGLSGLIPDENSESGLTQIFGR